MHGTCTTRWIRSYYRRYGTGHLKSLHRMVSDTIEMEVLFLLFFLS